MFIEVTRVRRRVSRNLLVVACVIGSLLALTIAGALPARAAAPATRAVALSPHTAGYSIFRVTVVPEAASIDSHVALAPRASVDWGDYVAAVHFRADGRIYARAGTDDRSDRVIEYSAGTAYELEFTVNELRGTYRASVKIDGKSHTILSNGFYPTYRKERTPLTTAVVRNNIGGRGLRLQSVATSLDRTATSRGREFVSRSFDLQPWSADVTVTASRSGMNGTVGFADHAARSTGAMLGAVQLRSDGTLAARRGTSSFTAERALRYSANRPITLRFQVDPNADTYSVDVRESGSTTFQRLISNAALARRIPSASSVDQLVVSAGRDGDILTAAMKQWVPSDLSLDPTKGPSSIEHILATGQSLSVGWGPALTDQQPDHNLMFSTGVIPGGELSAFGPLAEGTGGSRSESSSSAMANWLSTYGQNSTTSRTLMSMNSVGGAGYTSLRSGTDPFRKGIEQVRAADRLADAAGQSYRVGAVTLVHGETDSAQRHGNYASYLRQWQADYEREIKAITGQGGRIPMLQSQISSWEASRHSTSQVAAAQYETGITSPDTLPLVGPKYFLNYDHTSSLGIALHITADSQRHLGEYYAKVYDRVVRQSQTWRPVHPKQVRVSGDRVIADFHVPNPPLVLDTSLVSDPGNFGFEFGDGSSNPPRITGVWLSGSNQVTLQLAYAPRGSKPELRYAWTGTPGSKPGPYTGVRGNLRDSDTTRSQFGYPLYNWSVHFSVSASGNGAPSSNLTSTTTATSGPGQPAASAGGSDSTRPAIVKGLNARPDSNGGIRLGWSAGTDDRGVAGYVLSRSTNGTAGAQLVRLGTTTSFVDRTARAGTRYTYGIRAFDAAGNLSWHSALSSSTPSSTATANSPITSTPRPPTSGGSTSTDGSRPTTVRDIAPRTISTGVQLRWTPSMDNVRVAGYVISRSTNGTAGSTIHRMGPGTVFNDSNTSPGVRYTYSIRAFDAAGNHSWHSLASVTATN